jgi:hypothetical protein
MQQIQKMNHGSAVKNCLAEFAWVRCAQEDPSLRKLNLALALVSGLVGGVVSHYLAPPSVQAQSPGPAAAEVRARSFLLVNDKGVVVGRFSAEPGGKPAIRLFDASGREIWSAEGPVMRAATGR